MSITVKTNSGKPRLTWSAVSGAAKYEIWRATSKGGTYSKRYTTTGTRFTNSSAVTGHTYYYKVKAVCAKSSYGNSAFSGVKSIVCGRDTSDIIMSTADLDRLCAEANAYAESIGMKIDTQKSGWGTGYPVWLGDSSYSDALYNLKIEIKHHHEGVADADTAYTLVWYQSGGAFDADYEVCVGGA